MAGLETHMEENSDTESCSSPSELKTIIENALSDSELTPNEAQDILDNINKDLGDCIQDSQKNIYEISQEIFRSGINVMTIPLNFDKTTKEVAAKMLGISEGALDHLIKGFYWELGQEGLSEETPALQLGVNKLSGDIQIGTMCIDVETRAKKYYHADFDHQGIMTYSNITLEN